MVGVFSKKNYFMPTPVRAVLKRVPTYWYFFYSIAGTVETRVRMGVFGYSTGTGTGTVRTVCTCAMADALIGEDSSRIARSNRIRSST